MANSAEQSPVRIGVLALQGAFREHTSALQRCGAEAVEVRTPAELAGLQGLVVPGGESTAMANLADRRGLTGALKEFAGTGRPMWGTCAGLIFLADRAIGQKMGGQALLGGLDCTVHRNFFGSQINSFETELPVPRQLAELGGPDHFRAVFIRAPAVVESGSDVEILAEYQIQPGTAPEAVGSTAAEDVKKVAVAVKQGSILATAFHPELTSDTRWHQLFVRMVEEHQNKSQTESQTVAPPSQPPSEEARKITRPADLPVFRQSDRLSFEL